MALKARPLCPRYTPSPCVTPGPDLATSPLAPQALPEQLLRVAPEERMTLAELAAALEQVKAPFPPPRLPACSAFLLCRRRRRLLLLHHLLSASFSTSSTSSSLLLPLLGLLLASAIR